jgi:eukaryotic-like serine/threonine-protein kinase
MDDPGRLAAQFAGFEVDLLSGTLRHESGKATRLPEQSSRVLRLLLQRAGAVVSREELRKQLWPTHPVAEFDREVGAALAQLRDALGDSADNPRYIETLAGRGHRWLAAVTWPEANASLAASGEGPVEAVPPGHPAIGSQVSHYRVLERLGEGGMGVVYRGEDVELQRPVALKFISADLASDRKAVERLRREARAASALSHAHICTVYEIGDDRGTPFIAMEFLEGQTLQQRIRGQPLPLAEVLAAGIQITDALDVAHARGVIHRDLKPANIVTTERGGVKILDFGLAQVRPALVSAEGADSALETATREAKLTNPGVLVGTVAYMSPEQARGEPLDERSDLFSTGVILYEMATGRPAFPGEGVALVLDGILNRSPEAPGRLNPTLPPKLQEIIQKSLEKDRRLRYQSAGELRADLKRLERDHESGGVMLKPQPPAWRRMVQLAGIALLAVAAVALLVSRLRSPPPGAGKPWEPLTAFADSAVAPTLSPDGRVLVFIRSESTFEGPGEVYIKQLPHGDPVQVSHDGLIKEGPVAFSPDASRIAFTVRGDAGDTWTVPVLGGEPARLLARASALSWIEPAPGRRRVLFSSLTGEGIHMGIFESTESRGELRTVYLPVSVDGMAHRSFVSPDGKSVLVVEMDLGSWLPCRVVPYDGSSPGRRVGPEPAQCTDAAWSPDGTWMYLSANTGEGFHIWRQRFPDGVPEQVTTGASEEQGISFAPDGRSFVTSVGASQSTLWVHDAGGDRQITSEGFTFLPSFSADGRTLYYLVRSRASRRFVSGELWATSLETGRASRLLPDFLMEHYNVSRDGRRVVFLSVDETGHSPVWIAPLDGSAPPRRLASSDYATRALFDPRGGVLFVGGQRGASRLYHVDDDGEKLRQLVDTPVSFLYAVSPDGRGLALWAGTDVTLYDRDRAVSTTVCAGCGTAGEENRGVTPPLVSWSEDGKLVYLHATHDRRTHAVPLRPGRLLPPLPAGGLGSMGDAATLPGARSFPEPRAYGGPGPLVYAFPRVTTHRNIYRVYVP